MAKVKVLKAPQAPGKFVDKADVYPKFFAYVNKYLRQLRESQVDGFKHLFSHWLDQKLTDPRCLAYMLATAWHETGETMRPITEYGTLKYLKGKDYWPYIGRGYAQLTHKENYAKYGIANNVTKALDPDFAAYIIIDAMTKGIFTGKAFDDYFTAKKNDPVGARRIINGTDRAQLVASYHTKFLKAIMLEPGLKTHAIAIHPMS